MTYKPIQPRLKEDQGAISLSDYSITLEIVDKDPKILDLARTFRKDQLNSIHNSYEWVREDVPTSFQKLGSRFTSY